MRGNTSVFSDCLLARAWWRYRLAKEVEKTTDGRITRTVAHKLLHRHRPSWEKLVMLSLKRLTTINQPSVRAAIVHHLSLKEVANGKFNQNDVETIATGMARASLRRSLDHTPMRVLHEMQV